MGENEFVVPLFPVLALIRGDWSASLPGRFVADERVAVPIQYEAGWARNVSEFLKKNLLLSLDSNCDFLLLNINFKVILVFIIKP